MSSCALARNTLALDDVTKSGDSMKGRALSSLSGLRLGPCRDWLSPLFGCGAEGVTQRDFDVVQGSFKVYVIVTLDDSSGQAARSRLHHGIR